MIRVLVADDEPKVAQLICNLVDWPALDMEVCGVAQNGIEALEMIQSHGPDIVITDIRMPGCDGLELIRRAKEHSPALSFVIISGYRHFEYAQNAIRYGVSDYLLKPVNKEELTETLEKMRFEYLKRHRQLSGLQQMELRQKADAERQRAGLFALLNGPPVAGPMLETINRDYHFEMRPGRFLAVLIKVDGSFDEINAEGLELLRKKTLGMAGDALGPLCFEHAFVFEGTTARGLLNYAEAQSEAVRKALHGLLSELRVQNSVFPGAVFTIAMGFEANEPAGLWASAQSAAYTLAQRLVEKNGRLLLPVKGEANPERCAALLAAGSRQLEAALDVMDEERAAGAIAQFCQSVLEDGALSGQDVLYLAREMCDTYLRMARNLGLGVAEGPAVAEEFAQRVDMCGSAAQVLDCLAGTVAASLAAALRLRREADSKPITNAKQFMLQHYASPITLEQVAEQAGFNTSYFSTLFKKETGKNFSEYLLELRMTRAKELLRDTKLPVAQICDEVGYSDLKYFTQNFKKFTGVKPGEFRKLYS